MKAPSEADLVAQCLMALNLRGVFCWRQNSGAFVVGSGPARRFVRMVRGAEGVADVIGLLPGGRFLAVECKVGRNRPTEKQSAFLARVAALGGLALVVRDVRELDEAIEEACGG